ncbi:MAG: hypothetical protein AB1394_10300, partial [Bacteroidota bacterium]
QATAVLKMVNAEYEHVQKTSEALKANPMLKEFARDLLEVGAVSKEASEGIADFIKYNNISETQLKEVIQQLRNEQTEVGALSAEHKKYEAAINNMAAATNTMRIASTNSTRQAGQSFYGMNQVIGQTGFMLSDMDMFFRSNDWVTNVRMGTMSVANNFSMVGMSVANALRQAEEQGISWQQMLKSSLTGMNLWLLVLNGAVTTISILTSFLKSNSESLKDNGVNVENVVAEYNGFRDVLNKLKEDIYKMPLDKLDELFDKLQTKMQDLNRISPRFIDQVWHGLTFKPLTDALGINNPFLNEIQTTPIIFGKADKDKQAINETQTTLEQVQKRVESIRKNLSGGVKLDLLEPSQITKMKSDIDEVLNHWPKSVKSKTIGIGDPFKNTFVEIGTYSRTSLESLSKEIDKYNAKTKKQKQESTKDELWIDESLRKKLDQELEKYYEKQKFKDEAYYQWKSEQYVRDYYELLNAGMSKVEAEKVINSKLEELNKQRDAAQIDNVTSKSLRGKTIEQVFAESGQSRHIRNPRSVLNKEELKDSEKDINSVKSAFQSLGNTIASSLSRGITGLKNFKDLLMDILGSIIQISIQFAISKGLDSLFPGTGSVLKKASNISPTDSSNSRITSLGTNSFSIGNNIQYVILGGDVNVKAAGRDLAGSLDKRNVVVSKYYNKL